MKKLNLLFLVLFAITMSCNSDPKDNLVVLVKYKTQPNKNIDAIDALKTLITEVKKEDHFQQIRMYVDPEDNSNILLYEEWDNENYYNNEHLQTNHFLKFKEQSSSFLVGPPEITFWKLNETY